MVGLGCVVCWCCEFGWLWCATGETYLGLVVQFACAAVWCGVLWFGLVCFGLVWYALAWFVCGSGMMCEMEGHSLFWFGSVM